MSDRSCDVPKARVVFHIDPNFHARYRRLGNLAIFPLIEDIITARGGTVLMQAKPDIPLADRWGDGDLHIVQGGRAQGVGWLNTALAYLTGYWHLDPQGVLAESQLINLNLDPKADILAGTMADRATVDAFFGQLHDRFKRGRKARYKQSKARMDVPAECIAVFLQGRGDQGYIGQIAMLETVIKGAGGRPVVVKAHPLRPEYGAAVMAAVRAKGFDFITTTAHVHDVLAQAAVTVSVNSATAIEGFLHGAPAILFGPSDYASQVETVQNPAEFAAALTRTMTRAVPRDHAPWLYQYFNHGCINIEAPDAASRILQVFAEAGFDAARLGLNGG